MMYIGRQKMNRSLTFSDVLHNWQQYQRQQMQAGNQYSEIIIDKLFRFEFTNEWTTAWRKAASTDEITLPQILHSKNGVYKIEIRQSEANKENGLILLTVNKNYYSNYEGKQISIIDGKGKQLLKGKIQNGEVFERINRLDQIELKLMIRIIE
jgi:hypothetical protein